MNNTNLSTENGSRKPLALIKGVAFSIIISFAAFLILAALMLASPTPEWAYAASAIAVGLVSAFVGGFVAARKIGEKGWLWGGVSGICYYIIVYLCALAAFAEFNFGTKTLLMLVCGAFCGALGGIFAMGSRSKKRRR